MKGLKREINKLRYKWREINLYNTRRFAFN